MLRWLPLLAISLSTFMLLVDLTIVSVAAQAIAAGLTDGRRIFVAGLAVFALASLACGLATSTGMLIAARGVQGPGRGGHVRHQPPTAAATVR